MALSLKSTIKLNSGYEMPRLGLGVWQTPAAEAERVCREAFDLGYRHVDSAAAYRNEAPCGAAVRAAKVPRSEIFFTSKVPSRKLGYATAKEQVDKTLAETKLEYIDLMLIHAPYGGSEARKGAWKALVEAVEEGKVRSIGVSNYGTHHLDELENHIAELEEERGGKGKGGVLSVGQWEIHPWCPRSDIVEWCAKRNVAVEAYSPLVRGQRWGDAALASVAKKHDKTEAQILLRWSLQKGCVPLPKSETQSRIAANAQLYDFELSNEDLASLETGKYAPVCWDPVQASLDD